MKAATRIGAVSDVLVCDDVFACAAELGLEGLEIVLARGDFARPERLSELVRSAERAALEIPSLVLGSHNLDGGVADADPTVAARARAEVLVAVEWARVVGADAILIPFFLNADLADEAAVDRCADAFGELCPHAERAGVTLCIESSLAATVVGGVAERAGSDAFGCYFDPANLVVAGLDPAAEARALARLIRRVHLKDTHERRGDCHLGEGRVDFAACVQALEETGYAGWFALETPSGPPGAVAPDLSFARRLLEH
jgi:L-ribulose-5-phosphate 3-epimerase